MHWLRSLLVVTVIVAQCGVYYAQMMMIGIGSNGGRPSVVTVDKFVDNEDGTAGNQITVANLTADTHGTACSSWTINADPFTHFSIEAGSVGNFPFDIIAGGVTYLKTQTYTKLFDYDHVSAVTNSTACRQNGAMLNGAVVFLMNTNITPAAGEQIDFYSMSGVGGGGDTTCIAQTVDADLKLRTHTTGSGASAFGTPTISLTPNHAYMVSVWFSNVAPAFCNLEVYELDGTQVGGTSVTAFDAGTGWDRITFQYMSSMHGVTGAGENTLLGPQAMQWNKAVASRVWP